MLGLFTVLRNSSSSSLKQGEGGSSFTGHVMYLMLVSLPGVDSVLDILEASLEGNPSVLSTPSLPLWRSTTSHNPAGSFSLDSQPPEL